MSDKPTVHGTLSSLDTEASPGPFKYGLSGSKVVTFPDPGEMDWIEAEQFMDDVSGQKNSVVISKWLSPEDFEKLKAEKLTLYKINALMREVGKHYKGIFGDSGEGDASTAS